MGFLENVDSSIEAAQARLRVMSQQACQALSSGNLQRQCRWEAVEQSILFYGSHVPPCVKVAAFDLDGTLIHWKAGQKFSLAPGSWIWFSDNVIPKLQAKAGHPGSHEAAKFKAKMAEILSQVGVPITVYAATRYDHNRKPGQGMWKHFRAISNTGAHVDKVMSFYVGDAAGRKWDFSDSDRQFADRIGLPFNTPEEVFGPSSQPNHALAYYLETLGKRLRKTKIPDDVAISAAIFQCKEAIETHPEKLTSAEDAKAVRAVGDNLGVLNFIDDFFSRDA